MPHGIISWHSTAEASSRQTPDFLDLRPDDPYCTFKLVDATHICSFFGFLSLEMYKYLSVYILICTGFRSNT